MPEELEGYVNVQEAAQALGRSAEQVRRYLREGKLDGRRIGGQWFIRHPAVLYGSRRDYRDMREKAGKAVTRKESSAERVALSNRVNARREAISTRWQKQGVTLDAVELIHRIREDD